MQKPSRWRAIAVLALAGALVAGTSVAAELTFSRAGTRVARLSVAQLVAACEPRVGRRREPRPKPETPPIVFYQCDLTNMPELADDSIDAVVSVSALEHNEPAKLRALLTEMARVARPGAPLLHTVSATRDGAAFHQASASWLLDESGLSEAYGLRLPESNFDRYDELSSALENSRYLSRWLDLGYFRTGNNGMPWGVWDPGYMPVGIRKLN